MTRIIVKAVPARMACVNYLMERIPDAEICFDRVRNHWDTFVRAMEMAGNDPHIAMEEDVVLTRCFREKVEAAIAERPDSVIQFFSMRKDDRTVGSRWSRSFCMNQCTYFPRNYPSKVLEFSVRWPRRSEHPTGTDLMVNDFLRARKEPHWIHVPSLVNHLPLRSEIGRRSRGRQSLTFTDPWT